MHLVLPATSECFTLPLHKVLYLARSITFTYPFICCWWCLKGKEVSLDEKNAAENLISEMFYKRWNPLSGIWLGTRDIPGAFSQDLPISYSSYVQVIAESAAEQMNSW